MKDLLVGLVTVLAVAGGLALAYRSLGGIFRLVLRASQEVAARGLAEVSARHGDVTSMVERRETAARAREDRLRSGAFTLLWTIWFVAPLFLGVAREAYAVASVLWLVPRSFDTGSRRR